MGGLTTSDSMTDQKPPQILTRFFSERVWADDDAEFSLILFIDYTSMRLVLKSFTYLELCLQLFCSVLLKI